VLRVVLDANVYISALIRPQGPPGQIIRRVLDNSFEIVLSPAIVEKTGRAFAYPRVRKYIHAGVDSELWFEDVILLAQLVAGDYEVEGISVDADDDKYLAAAVEGSATLIVTGDPDLLTVKEGCATAGLSGSCGLRFALPHRAPVRAGLELRRIPRHLAGFIQVNNSSEVRWGRRKL